MSKEFPPIIFNNIKYYMRRNGYYEADSKTLSLGSELRLHRAIWVAKHGPIPEGFVIHHKDECKTNNKLSNFACILKKEHDTTHALEQWAAIPKKPFRCVRCGATGYAPVRGLSREKLYCSKRCKNAAKMARRASRNADPEST